MKLRIGFDEIEINVRHVTLSKEYNKADTMQFLNNLALLYMWAGKYQEQTFGSDLGYGKAASEIHKVLSDNGLYDEIRERRRNERAY